MKRLEIGMIAAYSPAARTRRAHVSNAPQERLSEELVLAGIAGNGSS